MEKFLVRMHYIEKNLLKSRTAVKWGLSLWNIWVCTEGSVCTERLVFEQWIFVPQETKAVQLKLEPRHWGCQMDRGKQRASSRALPREQGALRGAVGQRGRCKWAGQLPLCWASTFFPIKWKKQKKLWRIIDTTGECFYFTAKYQWVSYPIILHFWMFIFIDKDQKWLYIP